MQYREGRHGEKLSVLGYGCMRFTRSGGSIDIAKAEKEILEQAVDNYKSTRAIARVLQVSQPTIVRKLNKYGLATDNGKV